MGPAKGVQAAEEGEVGGPAVVDGNPAVDRQDADFLHGTAAAVGGQVEEHPPAARGNVDVVELSADAYSGLVEVGAGGLEDLPADELADGRPEEGGEAPAGVHDEALAEREAEKPFEKLRFAGQGNHLHDVELNGGRPDGEAIADASEGGCQRGAEAAAGDGGGQAFAGAGKGNRLPVAGRHVERAGPAPVDAGGVAPAVLVGNSLEGELRDNLHEDDVGGLPQDRSF